MYRAKGGAYWKKVIKGEWGMPRLLEAKKDVVSCEKLRGFANEICPQISEWDNPAGRRPVTP